MVGGAAHEELALRVEEVVVNMNVEVPGVRLGWLRAASGHQQ